MSNFASNLKFLRKKYSWSQKVMGEELNIARSTIADYERCKSEPSFRQLIKIANSCKVSIDDLLIKDLQKEQYEIIKNKHVRVLAISVDKENNENIEFVAQKAQAGYTAGYADPEYIAELPKLHIPNLRGATFRAFEIAGYSMLPIQPGSLVLASYQENLDNIKFDTPYILVLNDGIVFKRIKKGKNIITAVSDNEEYKPYTILKKDILEIWKFEAFVSFSYPEKTSLERIEQKVDNILDRI